MVRYLLFALLLTTILHVIKKGKSGVLLSPPHAEVAPLKQEPSPFLTVSVTKCKVKGFGFSYIAYNNAKLSS